MADVGVARGDVELAVVEVELHDVVVVRAADEGDAVHRRAELARLGLDLHREVLRDDVAVVWERALDEAGGHIDVLEREAHLIERAGDLDVAGDLGGQDVLELCEDFGGDDEFDRADGRVERLFFHSEPVGIRRRHREGVLVDVHVDAGEDGAALVIRAGKGRFFHKGTEDIVFDREAEIPFEPVDTWVFAGVHHAQRVVCGV